MSQTQPDVGANVLIFQARPSICAALTIRDRMQVAEWREKARNFGYDRLVIHERTEGDPPEVGSFLSVYRRSESWSRWGITRIGDGVVAWCCVTGANVGRFPTVAEALLALLPTQGLRQAMPAPVAFPRARPAVVTHMLAG